MPIVSLLDRNPLLPGSDSRGLEPRGTPAWTLTRDTAKLALMAHAYPNPIFLRSKFPSFSLTYPKRHPPRTTCNRRFESEGTRAYKHPRSSNPLLNPKGASFVYPRQ